MTLALKGHGTPTAELVPNGIKHPKSFLRTAKFLNNVALQEILHGDNPTFMKWKADPKGFRTALYNQLKSYGLGFFPFNTPVGANQTMLDWWRLFTGSENTELIAVSESCDWSSPYRTDCLVRLT